MQIVNPSRNSKLLLRSCGEEGSCCSPWEESTGQRAFGCEVLCTRNFEDLELMFVWNSTEFVLCLIRGRQIARVVRRCQFHVCCLSV